MPPWRISCDSLERVRLWLKDTRKPGGRRPYLLSVDRAQSVRDYLVGRFRRQTAITDIMPMGEDAASSPRDDKRWSGVALAMFVRNDAIPPVIVSA